MTFDPIQKFNQNKDKFQAYQDLLLKWNEKINLTAITRPDEIKELHFLDSLFLANFLENVSRETILDIGSGNGLPGLAVKIALPRVQITLVDSIKKKCDFMKAVVRELNLDGVEIICKHLKPTNSIGQFSAVISRATCSMNELLSLSLSNIETGGIVVGMKGSEVQDEIEACSSLLKKGNLEPIQEHAYTLPYSGQKRKLLFTVMGVMSQPPLSGPAETPRPT